VPLRGAATLPNMTMLYIYLITQICDVIKRLSYYELPVRICPVAYSVAMLLYIIDREHVELLRLYSSSTSSLGEASICWFNGKRIVFNQYHWGNQQTCTKPIAFTILTLPGYTMLYTDNDSPQSAKLLCVCVDPTYHICIIRPHSYFILSF
jgi:hypothetical protein